MPRLFVYPLPYTRRIVGPPKASVHAANDGKETNENAASLFVCTKSIAWMDTALGISSSMCPFPLRLTRPSRLDEPI
ncbi:hypothetical protein RUM44_008731 [Polyplax serrata]|uniref:Uncharacterized protein n=1 Tax=Polyplax serrata TaxID=468196 RepID=A0ABR1BD41_POLSC